MGAIVGGVYILRFVVLFILFLEVLDFFWLGRDLHGMDYVEQKMMVPTVVVVMVLLRERGRYNMVMYTYLPTYLAPT